MQDKLFPPLNFPPSEPVTVKTLKEAVFLHCLVRKKWFVASPEEWVRQNMLRFLVGHLNYPLGLISVEKSLHINGLNKRWDILVYKKSGSVFMLIELKAPKVPLQQIHLEQLWRYQSVIAAPYVVLSNGMNHHVFEQKPVEKARALDAFPEFSQH